MPTIVAAFVWICYSKNVATAQEFSAWHEQKFRARQGAMSRCYYWSGNASVDCEFDVYATPVGECQLIPRPKTREAYADQPDFGEPLFKP